MAECFIPTDKETDVSAILEEVRQDLLDNCRYDACAQSLYMEGAKAAFAAIMPQVWGEQAFLRHLVDVVWNDVTESGEVPSTFHADDLIALAKKNYSRAGLPEITRAENAPANTPDGINR